VAGETLDRLERLFRAARLHPEDERASFLGAACPDDPDLRARVEELLRADDAAEAEGFLEKPVTRLAASSVPPDELIGRSVGPYEVVRSLGRGGMGDVYLALRQAPFKRYVALKVAREGLGGEESRRRFAVERQILAALDHPGIARILDGGVTEDGLPYFAMEYVQGLPITRYADANRLDLPARITLFTEVCDAVHFAHRNLVLHRDLKPGNILVTADREVRLLDFGIAKLLNAHLGPADAPVTRTGLRPLTPEYASPEQVRGEPLTTASDVYSLGVLLYELLTGHRPHALAGRTTAEVLQLISHEEPLRPSVRVLGSASADDGGEAPAGEVAAVRRLTPDRLARRLRGDLDAIVLKALRKEPDLRYDSADALAADLRRALAREPVQARRGTRRYRAGRFLRRHRVEAVATGAVVVALIVGIAAALWQAGEARSAAARAEAALNETQRALRQSEEVTGFLMGLFQAGDPGEAGGDAVTAAQLMDRGLRRADELSAEPTVQARMLETIGRVQRSLGRHAEALALQERALAIRRREHGDEHPEVARSHYHLADVLRSQGRYSEADAASRRALAVQERTVGPTHPDVATTLIQTSGLAVYLGDLDEAVALARRALDIRVQALPPTDPLTATAWRHYGATLRRQGRVEEAIHAFRQALGVAESAFGRVHPASADAILQLAYTLADYGTPAEAERLLREGLQIRQRTLGPTHPQTAYAMGDLAHFLLRNGDPAEAVSLYRSEAEALEHAFGSQHGAVATIRVGLAEALRAAGRPQEAEATMRDALNRRIAALGADHPALWGTYAALGRLLIATSRPGEGVAMLREAIARSERGSGPENTAAATVRVELANALTGMRQYAEAESLLDEAEATYSRRGVRDRHADVQAMLQAYERLYSAWGRPADAARRRQRLEAAR
jgi:serine/threonine-protein kinase